MQATGSNRIETGGASEKKKAKEGRGKERERRRKREGRRKEGAGAPGEPNQGPSAPPVGGHHFPDLKQEVTGTRATSNS